MSEHTTAAQSEPSGGVPEDGLDAIRDFYAEELLRPPPIPRDMLARLVPLAVGEWGLAPEDDTQEPTRHDLTDRSDFLERATDPAHPDDLGFGHVGHGVSSWWMCYQIITPSLALFFRQGYGGPYTDAEAAREVINAAFYDAQSLIVMAEAGAEAGKIPPGQRLLVVLDGPDGSFWGLTEDPDHWHASPDPIGAAEAFLQD